LVKIDIIDRDVVKEKGIKILDCFVMMAGSPRLLMDIIDNDAEGVPSEINGDTESAYVRLLGAFREANFHCTHSVLHELDDVIDIDDELLRILGVHGRQSASRADMHCSNGRRARHRFGFWVD